MGSKYGDEGAESSEVHSGRFAASSRSRNGIGRFVAAVLGVDCELIAPTVSANSIGMSST